MSDQTPPVSQEEPSGTPPEGTPPAVPETPAAGEPPAATSPDDSELKKVRSEAQSLRKRLRELEAAEEERQKASMSDLEKAQKAASEATAERDALAASIAERDLNDAIRSEAATLKFGKPDLAVRLLDRSKIEVDGDGKPKNISDLLKAELEAAPELRAGASAGLTPGQGQQLDTPEARHARGQQIAYGRGGGNPMYDLAAAKAAGGGSEMYQPQPD